LWFNKAGIITTSEPRRCRTVEELVEKEGKDMLWTIAVILLIFWLLGFSFHVGGALIHLILVIAVIVVVIRLVTGRGV
jgi:hypothetical protein